MAEYSTMNSGGVPVLYTEEHRATAEAMAEAARKTIDLVAHRWFLRVPERCELRVLTDWESFVDETAPALLGALLRLTRPLSRQRTERAFALAGGWTMPWRGRPVVGVKPPELLARADETLGERLFVRVDDPLEKVRRITCHEFTHACTAHLKLPIWLNEGLAMRAVDHMVGEATVLEETRALAAADPSRLETRAYRRFAARDHDALIRLYASGYWAARRLDEESPSTLVEILQRRRRPREISRLALVPLRHTS